MSDVLHEAQQDFWRPPVIQPASNAALAEACRRCGTEFMVGAAFCHICGTNRHRTDVAAGDSWAKYVGILRTLEFARIKTWLGLPLPSLCAFLIGSAFILIALAQGFRSQQDFSDFEAIQLWRMQWLMAACAAFLAGILLKSHKSET